MRIVIALGGNAILQKGQALEATIQRSNIQKACIAIRSIADDNQLIITHGNGPQIGLLALQSASYSAVTPYPLDVLGAESEGMIGYFLEQELRNVLPTHSIATLLTQVEVDNQDPAFKNPLKYIGPQYTEQQAQQLAQQKNWQFAKEDNYYRRVVASPMPHKILESSIIHMLVNAGVIVICAGGGGIPVIKDDKGSYQGIEAVIDKDLVSALLAKELKADCLLMLTDVSAVIDHWGSPNAKAVTEITTRDIKKLNFAAGSMQPKVNAACHFVESTNGTAYIGALDEVQAILSGKAGTKITLS